jgi:DNA repair exonuclease SbcCD ATPase subunit
MVTMGSSPGSGAVELSFVDVLTLMKDEPAYQTKLRELARRVDEAAALNKATNEIREKVAEAQKFAAEMAAKAEQQLGEAKQLKEEADKKAADAEAHAVEIEARQKAWQKNADAELDSGKRNLRDAFVTREKEILSKEQQLSTGLKDLKALKDELDGKVAAHADFVAAKSSEFARRAADLAGEADRIQRAQAENDKLRQQLKEKLNQLKTISAG